MEAAPRPRYPGAGAAQLKAAVRLVGTPEASRGEISVRALMYPIHDVIPSALQTQVGDYN